MFYANGVISKSGGKKLPERLICWQREKARYNKLALKMKFPNRFNQNEAGKTAV